jgi:hypothetical protein
VDRTLPGLAPARASRRVLPDVLFSNPWAALLIPMLVPLVVWLA